MEARPHRARRRWLAHAARATLSSALLAALTLSGCGRPSGGIRIVLVTLDTLRFDCVEGAQPSMPRLAAAARSGAEFEAAYAASSSTQPTHASLFTGLHPWQHGVQRNGSVLEDSVQTVTEVLHAAGWWTGAVVASFPLHHKFGFAQGFDVYDDQFTADLEVGQWAEAQADGERFYTPGEQVTDAAVALLDRAPGDRQFLWVHYFDAHAPYGDTGDHPMKASELLAAARQRSPELPALIAQARRLYDQDTGYIDRALDRLARRLAQDEPGWQTHIVITADHGESFGDDGSFGHGKRLTPAEVHVPLILLSPRAAPGVREDVAASVDIASTLLALAGLPTQGFGHGRDLTQLAPAGGASAFGMRSTFAEPTPDVHVDGSVDELQGTLQFFAVIDGQQAIGNAQAIEGLAPAHGDDVRKLFSIFEAEAQARPVRELLDTQTQAALEALGYTR